MSMSYEDLIGYDDDDVSGLDYVGDDDDDEIGADPLDLLDAAVSGTDWVGDDDDEYDVGAARRGRFKSRGKASAAIKFKRAAFALAKRNKAMKKALARRKLSMEARAGALPQIFLGVDSGAVNIAAAAQQGINSEPNVDMRITDLIVDDSNAAAFRVTQIAATRVSMMASGDGIPATVFLSGVQRPPIRVPRVPAGTNVVTTVVNRSGAGARFEATYIGIDLTHRGI